MINKIKELTQAEVDAQADVSGLVNPSKVTLGGGGGADLSGKLEWGYPLGLLQGILPTVPTITGNTWTHTVEEASNGLGSTFPAVAYSSLLKNGTYVELDLSLPDEYIFFYAVLQNGLPSFAPLNANSSSAYVVIKVAPSGIELTSSIPSAAITIPNTEGVTSFGISAGQVSGYPRIHVNGTSYEVPLGTFELYHSLMTAYAGQVGDQVTVTLDPVSTVHQDPEYPLLPLSEAGGLLSPAMYGVPQAGLRTNTLDNPNDRAAYKISPEGLNQWFNRKALTQADIDNTTSTKGLVSGEQLAGLGGGGGPEVLKDWTTVSGPNITRTELTEGLTLSSLGRLTVQFHMSANKGAGSRRGKLIAMGTGASLPASKSYNVTSSTSLAPTPNNLGSATDVTDYLEYNTRSDMESSSSGEVRLVESPINGRHVLTVGGSSKGLLSSASQAFSTQSSFASSFRHSSLPLTELFFEDGSGQVTSFEYRILRN